MTNTRRFALIGLATAITLTGGYYITTYHAPVAKIVTSAPSPTMHNEASVRLLQVQSGDAYDAMFITMMSEHHSGAIAMALPMSKEGVDPEVQHLASVIIEAQTRELADMKAWATTWGYRYSPPEEGAAAAMAADVVGKSGKAQEKQFLADMIVHHKSALAMATLSDSRAAHPEIKSLSANIITSQSAEISQMTKLAQRLGYSTDSESAGNDSMHHSTMSH